MAPCVVLAPADETEPADGEANSESDAVDTDASPFANQPPEVIDDITNEYSLPASIDDWPNLEFWPRWMAIGAASEMAKMEKTFVARQLAHQKISEIFSELVVEMENFATEHKTKFRLFFDEK